MRSMLSVLLIVAVAASAMVAGLAATPAQAADLAGRRAAEGLPSAPGLPGCDDPAVLGKILDRQHWAEANTWQNGVRIEAIGHIRQTTSRTKFVSAIEHRHCRAVASLGPRKSDALYYMISRGLGFASIGWEVDFCMPRHDYWRVYDAGCRVLR